MRKAYIIDIPGDDKSIIVTELTGNKQLVLQVGYEKIVLSYHTWKDLMDLNYKVAIKEEETDYEHFDIRSSHQTDPAGKGSSSNCAQMDWDDKEAGIPDNTPLDI